MNDRNQNGPSWKIRRRIIFSTLIFCCLSVLYIMIYGEDTRVNETIVLGCFALAGSVIGSYIFGAVFDDNNQMQAKNEMSKNTITPSNHRRKMAEQRLERMKAKKEGIDNPDA